MTVQIPEGTKTLGTRSVWIIPLADVTDPSELTKTEVDAGFRATCYIYGQGGVVTGAQNKGTAPRRLCEVKDREQLGTVQESISDIQYVYSPQGADNDPENEMKASMVDGTKVVIAERLGLIDSTPTATAQKFNSFVTTLGYRNRTMTSDDEYGEYSITQSASVDAVYYDVALA